VIKKDFHVDTIQLLEAKAIGASAALLIARALSPDDLPRMTLLSTAQHFARASRRNPRGHLLPIVAGSAIAVSAVALVAYLLWPTWEAASANGPG